MTSGTDRAGTDDPDGEGSDDMDRENLEIPDILRGIGGTKEYLLLY